MGILKEWHRAPQDGVSIKQLAAHPMPSDIDGKIIALMVLVASELNIFINDIVYTYLKIYISPIYLTLY